MFQIDDEVCKKLSRHLNTNHCHLTFTHKSFTFTKRTDHPRCYNVEIKLKDEEVVRYAEAVGSTISGRPGEPFHDALVNQRIYEMLEDLLERISKFISDKAYCVIFQGKFESMEVDDLLS